MEILEILETLKASMPIPRHVKPKQEFQGFHDLKSCLASRVMKTMIASIRFKELLDIQQWKSLNSFRLI